VKGKSAKPNCDPIYTSLQPTFMGVLRPTAQECGILCVVPLTNSACGPGPRRYRRHHMGRISFRRTLARLVRCWTLAVENMPGHLVLRGQRPAQLALQPIRLEPWATTIVRYSRQRRR